MQSYAAKIVPVFSCWSLALWNISTNWKAHNVMIILKMCLFCKGGMRWRTRDREEDAFKVHFTRQTSLPPTETNSGIFHNLDTFFMLLFFRRCINYSHWWQKRNKPWPCRSLHLSISSYCYSSSQTLHYVPLQITGTTKSSASHLPKHTFDSTHRWNRFWS